MKKFPSFEFSFQKIDLNFPKQENFILFNPLKNILSINSNQNKTQHLKENPVQQQKKEDKRKQEKNKSFQFELFKQRI